VTEVLGGGGREGPVKQQVAGGGEGGSTGREGPGEGGLTGALRTGFTLVLCVLKKMGQPDDDFARPVW
jgi:hypothetical protein